MMGLEEPADINPEEDLFYFETDHLALKGNKDYSEVLKTLFVLCAQRDKALKDYTKAVALKKEALEDPALVLEKIIKGESLGMPDMHCVPELPVIDWSKYDVKVPEDSLKQIYTETTPTKVKQEHIIKKESKYSSGRWTTEEQKKLEELLHVYPPELVEMRRWKKIADALGNRTIQQVTSRVQKYFLKLYKAGLPIPGRIPKAAEKTKKSSLHRHQRHNHYLWKPTTFFPELDIPVVMNDLDNVPGPSSSCSTPKQESGGSNLNYLLHTSYHTSNEEITKKSETELQLDLLKRVRRQKVREKEANSPLYHHIGYRCDFCDEDPIVGTRWHCMSCQRNSVDFCTDCVLAQMYSENCHPLSHNLVSFSDRDVDYSNSDSGSNQGSSYVNNASSDSSDSDFMDDNDNGDEVMSDVSEKTGGVNAAEEINNEERDKDDFFWSGLETDTIFNEIDNVSYNYLHSNLLLDQD